MSCTALQWGYYLLSLHPAVHRLVLCSIKSDHSYLQNDGPIYSVISWPVSTAAAWGIRVCHFQRKRLYIYIYKTYQWQQLIVSYSNTSLYHNLAFPVISTLYSFSWWNKTSTYVNNGFIQHLPHWLCRVWSTKTWETIVCFVVKKLNRQNRKVRTTVSLICLKKNVLVISANYYFFPHKPKTITEFNGLNIFLAV